MTARFLAGVFGLLAFAVCIIGGLVVGATAVTVIQRALQAMIIFAVLGFSIGWASEVVIREYVRKELEQPPKEPETQRQAASQETKAAGEA